VVSVILVAAFALSATHTVYSYVTGIGDPSFTVNTPVAWVFYAVGFASAALARRESRAAEVALLTYLTILLVVAVFWYPTTFVPRQQTVFGWFENDEYTGLLMIAWVLTALRLSGRTLVPGRDRG
jgi:peptidoglycan/LPS O-acetylase OafA/YrhL